MNYQQYLGRWKNTYIDSTGVKYFDFFEKEGKLFVTIEGNATSVIAGKWDAIACKPYAKTIDSKLAIAFQATYHSAAFDAYLQFNFNKGLIVLAILVDFRGIEGKSDVFIREFFGQ